MEKQLEFELLIEGEAAEATSRNVQEWLRSEGIRGLTVDRKRSIPAQDEMGAEPMTVLTVLLSAPAVSQLIACLRAYVETRKPKSKICIQVGDLKITAEGDVSVEKLTAAAAKLKK